MAKGQLPLKPHYTDASAVTPGAGDLPDGPCRALACTASGTATVTTVAGTTGIVIHLIAGQPFPIAAIKVTAATATGIVALY